jgi:surfeit locus 1 family protein
MRRRLILSIAALAGIAALLALGTWQIQRLHWKEGLIAEREAAVAAAPVPLPATLDAARDLDFHRVRAEGVFRHDREMQVNATDRTSGIGGYLVVTPLDLGDGRVVLVERGWVPRERRAAGSRIEGNVTGRVVVDGLLRLPQAKPGWFVPENDPARGEWFYIDPAAMARAAGVSALPYYVEAGPAPNPGNLPKGGQADTALRNDHLQYAITWYALAAALAVIYIVLIRRHAQGEPV